MSDLVKRLREEGLGWGIGPALVCQEAAARIEALEAEVAALKPAAGMVIVPREPTEAMLDAGRCWASCECIYRAMTESANG